MKIINVITILILIFSCGCSHPSKPSIIIPNEYLNNSNPNSGTAYITIINSSELNKKIKQKQYSQHEFNISLSDNFMTAASDITKSHFKDTHLTTDQINTIENKKLYIIKIYINNYTPQISFKHRYFNSDYSNSTVKFSARYTVTLDGNELLNKTIESTGNYACDAKSDYKGGTNSIENATQEALAIFFKEYAIDISKL